MNTLMCIHAYPGARDTVWRHWEYYKLPGWPILGIDCEDGRMHWPDKCPSVGIGLNIYTHPTNLPNKLVGTLKAVLSSPEYRRVTHIFVTEHDSIFIRKPEAHPGGLLTNFAGGPMRGFEAKQFFHPPWWVDRDTAEIIVNVGSDLIRQGRTEHGSPDVFLGLISDVAKLKWAAAKTVSVNSGDFDNRRAEIEKAVKDGVWFVHGLKTKDQLDWVLGVMGNK